MDTSGVEAELMAAVGADSKSSNALFLQFFLCQSACTLLPSVPGWLQDGFIHFLIISPFA